MASEPVDFVQLTYNPVDREAEDRLLPLAREKGIGIIVNRPFRQGALTKRLANEPLPDWAAEVGADSWAQLILKFILAHPAVTCTIPATTRVNHVQENLARRPGATARRRLAETDQRHHTVCLMETLASYHPRDLLLFSPRVYWTLVAGNNEVYWPLALLAPVVGLWLMWTLAKPGQARQRTGLAVLGAAWLFVTWSFLWAEYRSINWAITWAIGPFVLQGCLLLVLAGTAGSTRYRHAIAT